MDFRTIEQIMAEQPSIERKLKFRGNTYKLINTTHDISHREFTDLTCYTYRNEEIQQNLLLYCRVGKIVIIEIE
ncbi:hypothetical protein ABID96_000638 [Bacillus sp. OAE603]